MQITVNGEPRETEAATLSQLVAELSLDPNKVAIERNLEIVPRSLHAATPLGEGDRLEIVQFVGGG
ncbi:sulfur carrier protein ThiS [Brevundimonas lutea]|uniref:sulfur carrier protein ThiS n=1 Tax=Brevundimonas lutea TaxID=2293980 RepID=UPI000F025A45|nr:sulfur carrier protein ThiS [Brevundimonas lutea]